MVKTLSGSTFWTVAPYAAWMALMLTLPTGATPYAVRTAASGVLLAAAAWWWLVRRAPTDPAERFPFGKSLAIGLVLGVIVLGLWVLPESNAWYRRVFTYAAPVTGVSPYDPAACGWGLALARLFGSAFVIAPAEELFFRSFLYRRLQARDWMAVKLSAFDASAFFWTTGLFALEHDRWLVGALAGAAYQFAAARGGIAAAIVAHAVTNLLLGIYVLAYGAWGFW